MVFHSAVWFFLSKPSGFLLKKFLMCRNVARLKAKIYLKNNLKPRNKGESIK